MKRFFRIYLSIAVLVLMVAFVSACNWNENEKFTLLYLAEEGGYIQGETSQEIVSGEDAGRVLAVPNDGYEFVEWSDGITMPERQEKNVTANKTVRAQFKKKLTDEPEPIQEFTVTYRAEVGGEIEGKAVQKITRNESAEAVVAVPETGYKFVEWSDGVTIPERQDKNIIKNQTLTAKFEKITFTVRYECNQGGTISVTTANGKGYGGIYVDFEVKYGDDCEKIIAVKTLSAQSQRFVGWTDGVETEERQEKNVTSDITIRAKFGYELTYTVASGKGSIIGNTRQLIEDGEWSEPVKAVAAEGYVFSGWSDMVMDTTHKLSYQMKSSQEYVVYFEPKERTFRYEYGVAVPLKTEITIYRDLLNEAVFEIPQREGYVFRGWYADDEYKMKVVHESGKLMLGLQTLNLETDALYARWEKIGEGKKTYKILMIMVDEIYTTLYSSRIEQDILVDYKMTGVERKLCSVIPPKISQYLNKWFEGRVIFEIDTYFTREVIREESFSPGVDSIGVNYAIFGYNIQEIDDIIAEYECTIVTHSMNDYNSYLHNEGGLGEPKHAMHHIEPLMRWMYPNQNNIEAITNYNGNGEINGNQNGLTVIVSYLHEFSHTIEQRYMYYSRPELEQYAEEVYELHKWECIDGQISQLEKLRQYLLKQAMVDGEYVGIPTSYWEEFYN